MRSADIEFGSLDATTLSGTLTSTGAPRALVVMAHGGGVTRDEGGFFVRLAEGLATAGAASLRFDLRGHGRSGGDQRHLTLAAVGNDIRAAAEHLASLFEERSVGILGASFSGGICALLAAHRPSLVNRLVLVNPLLDYKKRFIDDKEYWSRDRLDASSGRRLADDGYIAHSPSFRLSQALLNEVFWTDARASLPRISAPTLLVHGTADTFIPVESSRSAAAALSCPHELMEIEGAQHGIAVPEDPGYLDPRTQRWQASVITAAAGWLTG